MDALLMAVLATASVGLWTLRVAVTSRGARAAAAAVAAVEAVVYASTFGRLLADLTAVDRLAGFALGVAVGTYLGLLVDQRLRRLSQARGGLDVQVGVGQLGGERAGDDGAECAQPPEGVPARVEAAIAAAFR